MMFGAGPIEFIILIFVYISGGLLGAVLLGVGIALGIRWGFGWALKDLARDSELGAWLKQLLNPPDK